MCPATCEAVALRLPRRRKNEEADAAADAQTLADFVRTYVPRSATLWVEKAIVGKSGNRGVAIHMGIANGTVIGAHRGTSHLVLPMVWKAKVVGHGHADKPACGAWLAKHYPQVAEACKDDEDLVDAACVGLYGQLAAHGRLEDVRQVQGR